jgi:hypothetical protein
MFESVGLREDKGSETAGLDALDEEYELRRLQPLNNFFLLPVSGILTFVALFFAGLPRLLVMPTLCLTYGILSVPALLIYDRVVVRRNRSLSDYLLLGLAVVRDSLWFIFLAIASGAISLFMAD